MREQCLVACSTTSSSLPPLTSLFALFLHPRVWGTSPADVQPKEKRISQKLKNTSLMMRNPAPRPQMGGLAPRPQTGSPEPRSPLQLMEPLCNHCQKPPDHHQQASWPQIKQKRPPHSTLTNHLTPTFQQKFSLT